MAKAQKQEETKENMQSILGKIKNIVSGKEKVSIEEEKPDVQQVDEEPMELTEIIDNDVQQNNAEALAEVVETTQATASEMPADAISAESDKGENMVDLLQEIDQALEQQYKESQAVSQSQPQVAEVTQELSAISQAEANANVAQEQPQNVEIKPEEPKKEFPEEITTNIMASQVAPKMVEEKSQILSQDIAEKSSKAIQNLLNNIPRPDIDSPAFRSAVTIEDLVLETLKPMLREWLDKNLETLVRDIVEREIRKIIPRE